MSQTTGPKSNSGKTGTTPPVRTSAKQTAARKAGAATVTVESDSGPTFPKVTSEAAPAPAVAPPAVSDAAPKPATKQAPKGPSGPRRVRLSVSRIDPWSVIKLGFLLSVAFGIATVVAAAVGWRVLDSMGVFAELNGLVESLDAVTQFGPLLEYLKLKNVMSIATVIAIVNIALITALSTLGAFLYNIVAALVGGLHMTLTDD